MESQEAPIQVFRSVWLLHEPRSLSRLAALAFDDTGSVMIFPEHLEFHGKRQRLVLNNISSVRPGRYGLDFLNEWLRIQYANGATTYLKDGSFAGWAGLVGGNGRLFQALKHLINTSGLAVTSSQDRDMQIIFTGEQSIPVAKEEIAVPAGVKIKVRRSKSITRSVEFKDRLSFRHGAGITLKQVVELSIQRQYEQETGSTFHTNETVDYEVELDGSVATRYSLSWIEVWREGIAKKIGQSLDVTGETSVPFRVRERIELDVQTVE